MYILGEISETFQAPFAVLVSLPASHAQRPLRGSHTQSVLHRQSWLMKCKKTPAECFWVHKYPPPLRAHGYRRANMKLCLRIALLFLVTGTLTQGKSAAASIIVCNCFLRSCETITLIKKLFGHSPKTNKQANKQRSACLKSCVLFRSDKVFFTRGRYDPRVE